MSIRFSEAKPTIQVYDRALGKTVEMPAPEKPRPSRAVATPDIKKPPEQISVKKERRPMTAQRKAVRKKRTTICLVEDALDWYRSLGPGWQLTMQDVLIEYMNQQKKEA